MATQSFDELNSLSFDRYFGEMGISKQAKQDRIRLARLLEPYFWDMFDLIATYLDSDITDLDFIKIEQMNKLVEIVEKEVPVDDYLIVYLPDLVRRTIDTTVNHRDDPYYVSGDRAKYIAENESNTIWNYEDYQEAVATGCSAKTWHTIEDYNVRLTHQDVDGITIPINEAFHVGMSQMKYPKDTSLGADPTEIINCRCWVTYS